MALPNPHKLAWMMDLRGGFEFRDPDGRVLAIKSRKAEALFARLAIEKAPISRRDLVRDLWGEADEAAGLANLRQVIRHLRSAIGEGWIETNRDMMWLSATAALDVIDSPGSNFMIGHSEPWCEWRRGTNHEAGSKAPSPVAGYQAMLSWLAHSDPLRAAEALRDHPDLAQGLEPELLGSLTSSVLSRMPHDTPLYGWALLQQAFAQSMTNEVRSAFATSKIAAKVGQIHHDVDLYLESLYVTGWLLIVAGHAERARTLAQDGLTVAEQRQRRLQIGRMLHLLGTADVHLGRVERGIKLIEQSRSCFEPNEIEVALSDSLRALYLATAGKEDAAIALLDQIAPLDRSLAHLRLTHVCRLARALVLVKANDTDVAREALESLVRDSGKDGSSHLNIYSQELLAVAEWRLGDRASAIASLKSARDHRRELQMGFTAWDDDRIAELRDGLLRFGEAKVLG
jgi:tetratricopeptide (TPR) repeat protein